MEDKTVVVLMLKNCETGILEREITGFAIETGDEYLVNLFAEEKNGDLFCHVRLSIAREVSDDEFDAFYDSYETNYLKELGFDAEISELEGFYNPTWEAVFKLTGNDTEDEARFQKLVSSHQTEVLAVIRSVEN